MTLPSTGAISFANLNTEFGNSAGTTISLNDALTRNVAAAGNTGIQTSSGTYINLGALRGHAYGTYQTNGTVTNVNVTTYMSSAGHYAPGQTYGVINIGSSGVVGSTSAGSYAMTIQGTNGDIFNLQNAGYIVGIGGNGGAGGNGVYGSFGVNNGSPGTTGGPALLVQGQTSFLSINNSNTIGSGGSGGGGGYGTGVGQGGQSQSSKIQAAGGGGGGGGAGYVSGTGAPNGYTFWGASAGQNGSLTSGGAGGSSYYGAAYGQAGGSLGQAGSYGTGNAISGISYVQGSIGGNVLGPTS